MSFFKERLTESGQSFFMEWDNAQVVIEVKSLI